MDEDAHGGGDHMPWHGHVLAPWQGAIKQGKQRWGLNQARNILASLCRRKSGATFNRALDSNFGWILPTMCSTKWPHEQNI